MIRTFAGIALVFFVFGRNGADSKVDPKTDPKVDPKEVAKKDLEKLQGQWVIAALEVNGVDVPQNKLDGSVLTIKDDSYVIKIKDKSFPVKITLDPSKDPKEIDMLFLDGANKDRVQKGIYTFKNDRIQIARGIDPDQNRPRDFATWPNSNYFVVTWQKKD